MKKDDVPDIHKGDTKAWEEYWGQAEWDEEVKKEEKWESGDTITIGEARKKLGIHRAKYPSGEDI